MSVTAVKAPTPEPRTHMVETPAAVRTQEDRRVKDAAHLDHKTVEPVRPPASASATSSSAVQGALASLKKGG